MLRTVTITGADDTVQPWQLANLSKEFPFVEWGLLFSGARDKPRARWVTDRWARLLADELRTSPRDMKFALHLCGTPKTRILEGSPSLIYGSVEHIPGVLLQACRRIQINTHGEPQGWSPSGTEWLWREHFPLCHLICQIDGGCGETIFNDLANKNVDVYRFFDLSHGAGVTPDEWPAVDVGFYCDEECPVQPYVGYGGGLGLDNLATQIPKILKAAGPVDCWIDMETRVRTVLDNDARDDIFDLQKVRKCLEICAPFVNASV